MPGPELASLGKLPQTPRAKAALQFAVEAAQQFGHIYVGTEHLLLGLVWEGQGVAAHVLEQFGVDQCTVAAAVLQLLGEDFVDGPNEFLPSKRYHDFAAEEQEAVDRLNRQIGRLHWEKEAAVADECFEAAAAFLTAIMRLEEHKHSLHRRRQIDERITSKPPSGGIERR